MGEQIDVSGIELLNGDLLIRLSCKDMGKPIRSLQQAGDGVFQAAHAALETSALVIDIPEHGVTGTRARNLDAQFGARRSGQAIAGQELTASESVVVSRAPVRNAPVAEAK